MKIAEMRLLESHVTDVAILLFSIACFDWFRRFNLTVEKVIPRLFSTMNEPKYHQFIIVKPGLVMEIEDDSEWNPKMITLLMCQFQNITI